MENGVLQFPNRFLSITRVNFSRRNFVSARHGNILKQNIFFTRLYVQICSACRL
uniref:Uncharacterized protein n=1 Tax=Anguilla anguilla TaxID=7936 RepID=A0A0E9PWX4_ANGAN